MTDTPARPSFSDRIVAMAHSKWLLLVLVAVATVETTFLPMPYEAIFIALCLAARERIWLFILASVLGSAIGGSIVYWIGATYFETAVAWFGAGELVATYSERFAERGSTFIFLGGTTPAPSYIINLIAGASGFPYVEFVTIFSASRLLRFAVLGLLLFLFGDRLIAGWEALPKIVRRGLTVLLIGGLIYWFVSGLSG